MLAQPDTIHLVTHRLFIQHLLGPPFTDPAAAVAHFGAVQGQDTLYSLWALGLRVAGATEAGIEQAIVGRQLVRTWPMRMTLHYVTAADARWIVQLNSAKTLRGAARRLRELELDDETFGRSRRAVEAALAGGQPLTRPALYEALEAAGVSTAGQRGYYLMWYHANEGLIAIGPRQGKQQTVVLLDAWLPPTPAKERDDALAELAWRYFRSHGPATIKDYIWWSGLAAAEARAGLEMAKPRLASETIGKETYWYAPPLISDEIPAPVAHLLPFLDEYLVAYRDREAVLPPAYNALVDSGSVIFHPPLLVNGRVAGIWTRQLKKGGVVVMPALFRPLGSEEQSAVVAAAKRLGEFLQLPVEDVAVS
jgi:hypothetical protein